MQAKNVRIVSAERRASDAAPTACVSIGRAESGAGWTKTSQGGREYLALKLDDPSFATPVFADLVEAEDEKAQRLIRSRQSGRAEDRRHRTTPPGTRPGRGSGLTRSSQSRAWWLFARSRPGLSAIEPQVGGRGLAAAAVAFEVV